MSAKACRLLPAAFLIVLALAPPAGAGVLSGPETPAGGAEHGLFAWLADLLGELGFSGDAAELEEVPSPPPPDSLLDLGDLGDLGGLGSNSGPGIDPNGPPAS